MGIKWPTSLPGRIAGLWRDTAVVDSVFQYRILQFFQLLLFTFTLLQSAFPHRFADVLLEGELSDCLINLPLQSEISLERVQLRLLETNILGGNHMLKSGLNAPRKNLFPYKWNRFTTMNNI